VRRAASFNPEPEELAVKKVGTMPVITATAGSGGEGGH
jgi:hypothetical protein